MKFDEGCKKGRILYRITNEWNRAKTNTKDAGNLFSLKHIEIMKQPHNCKVKDCEIPHILKGNLDLIPSPSPSVKIQIMGGKVCLRSKGKTLLGIVNKLLKTKSLLTSPSNVLPYYLK